MTTKTIGSVLAVLGMAAGLLLVACPQARAEDPKLVPLKLELPKPLFEGTPKALKGLTLAKPRGINEQFMAPDGAEQLIQA